MGRLIIISGGIKSGKTRFALSLANEQPRLYIATAQTLDAEMYEKIIKHKKERKNWDTWITPVPDKEEFEEIMKNKSYKTVLIDCINMFLLNCLMKGIETEKIANFIIHVKEKVGKAIVITNETGEGVIPGDPLSREFVNKLGTINSKLAEICDEFYFMISGLKLKLK